MKEEEVHDKGSQHEKRKPIQEELGLPPCNQTGIEVSLNNLKNLLLPSHSEETKVQKDTNKDTHV